MYVHYRKLKVDRKSIAKKIEIPSEKCCWHGLCICHHCADTEDVLLIINISQQY